MSSVGSVTRVNSGVLITAALGAGFVTVISLVLPWFEIAGKSRSSVDLLSSASALDVIEGGVKLLAIGCWALAPILVASAMLVAPSGRHRLAAALLAPVAAITLAAVAIGAASSAIGLAWGAFVGAVFAAVASTCAITVLVAPRSDSKAAR